MKQDVRTARQAARPEQQGRPRRPGGDLVEVATDALQAVGDVRQQLAPRQRVQTRAHADAFVQLSHVRFVHAALELGLSGQQDLQQLLVRSLDVGQQAEAFEGIVGQVLGLVDHEGDGAAARIALPELGVQGGQHRGFVA